MDNTQTGRKVMLSAFYPLFLHQPKERELEARTLVSLQPLDHPWFPKIDHHLGKEHQKRQWAEKRKLQAAVHFYPDAQLSSPQPLICRCLPELTLNSLMIKDTAVLLRIHNGKQTRSYITACIFLARWRKKCQIVHKSCRNAKFHNWTSSLH